VIQDFYLEHQVDVEVSDEDNNGRTKLIGDDTGGVGAPSVETFAPNPIGSSLVGESCPSAVDQTTTTAPLGNEQKKKHVAFRTKRK
jgi:hypothetical protein